MEKDIILKVSEQNSMMLQKFSEVVSASVDDLVNEAISLYFDIMKVATCRITSNLDKDGDKDL